MKVIAKRNLNKGELYGNYKLSSDRAMKICPEEKETGDYKTSLWRPHKLQKYKEHREHGAGKEGGRQILSDIYLTWLYSGAL